MMRQHNPRRLIALGAAFLAIAGAFYAQDKAAVATAFIVIGMVFLLRGIRGSRNAR